MENLAFIIRLACLGFVFNYSALAKEELSGDGLLVLEDVTLIDGSGAAPLEHVVIVIQDSRIKHIGKVGDFTYPGSADVRLLSGHFVIPGLIDVHTHIQAPIHEVQLNMLLAYGVTSIRIPGGTDIGVRARQLVRQGKIAGPRIFTGGRVINGPGGDDFVVRSEEEIRNEVKRQYANGVDLVKFYYALPPKLVAAGVEEAHRLGIKALGHLSSTSWMKAAEIGIDGLLHNTPVIELLSPQERLLFAQKLQLSLEEFDNQPTSKWQLL